MIGNSDANGVRNNQGEFILPLTLDLFTDKPLSVYFGSGILTNVDSSDLTVFSLSGGRGHQTQQQTEAVIGTELRV